VNLEPTASKPIDRAELVAGRAVFFLFGDGGEIGDVIGRCHGDRTYPQAGEGGMAIEQRTMLGVGVEQVEGSGLWARGLGALDVSQETAEDGELEGMKEEGEGGLERQRMRGGVGVMQEQRGERMGERVALPEGDVAASGLGERGVELDAFDAQEGMLRGEQHGAAFAGADVEEHGALDSARELAGRERAAVEPAIEQAMKDAGRDAVVSGELFDLGSGAVRDDAAWDESRGVGAMQRVEGMNRGFGAWHESSMIPGALWGNCESLCYASR
jgi:hypothetical protein